MRRLRYICGGDEGRFDVGSAGGACGAVMELLEDVDERLAAKATWSGETFGGGAPLTMRSNCEVAISFSS